MKFPLSWLKDHLNTTATPEQIGEKLTAIGLEVEEIIDNAARYAPFIVAEILEATPHPNATKLQICRVNNGREELQIVCGAPNARAGLKVVLAPIGTVIPLNNMVIKASTIRGVASNGMLCSAQELQLGEDSQGIIELPQDAKPGTSFVQQMGLDDPVFDIAITPNRGDCLGVYGVARDLAAAGLGVLHSPQTPHRALDAGSPSFMKEGGPASRAGRDRINIAIENPKDCPVFIGRYFRNVKNTPSPAWLQQRLKAIGLNPISALVDITNYILFDLGRPLHVYDAKKLNGTLTVREAKEGEAFQALNGKEYTLPKGAIAIADDSTVHALGGIIGGQASACDMDTSEIVLEVALFNPVTVANTGRNLGIITDSRYRFERNVDPGFVKEGAEIATRMILELCGGEAGELVIAGEIPSVTRSIDFPLSKVETLGGLTLPEEEITRILKALGFGVELPLPVGEGWGEGKAASSIPAAALTQPSPTGRGLNADTSPTGRGLTLTIPSWRSDIEGEADIVEEILRIHGYDAIPYAALPHPQNPTPIRTARQQALRQASRELAARGLTEVITWSFMDAAKAALFTPVQKELLLLNPISSDLNAMRPSILPNLLDAAKRNANRSFADIALFETGSSYRDATPGQGQDVMIAGLRTGQNAPKNIYQDERRVDAFDAKADILAALSALGAPESVQVTAEAPHWYHPGRSGAIKLGKTVLGYFGELHPTLLQKFDIEGTAIAFELFVDALPASKPKKTAKPKLELSAFQPVTRDFAFIVAKDEPVENILRIARKADKLLIDEARVFDIYAGKGVEDGKKSVAISIRLQPKDKTLTDEEIEAVAGKVVSGVEKEVGGVLRS